ncbi:MAG: M28 family peptidase [Candidatus Acidiferrales bacterium]
MGRCVAMCAILTCLSVAACNSQTSTINFGSKEQAASQSKAAPSVSPSASTGGFDGSKAFEHVRRLVELGPRPPDSEAIRQAQSYIVTQLESYGCPVEEHDFQALTPIGELRMKNIIAKIPGTGSGIVMYATHYDTVRVPNFVGADDGGSGTGTMLELARVLCPLKEKLNIWIVFFDGEEAQGYWPDKNSVQWTNENSTFGSREMVASMALSGDLKRLDAMILADMIGPSDLRLKRENNSAKWLTDIIWTTASRLGYGTVFINESFPEPADDHISFRRRGVAATDIIDFEVQDTYWHTPQDTLDKVAPNSLAIAGHVFIEILPELEARF